MKPDTDLHDRLERAGGSVSIDVSRRLDAVHAVAERRGRSRRAQALAVAAVIGVLAVLAVWQLRSSDGRAPAPATTAGPDGRIAFLGAYGNSRDLFVVEASEGDSRPLFEGSGTVLWGAWSPDGAQLALTLELEGPRYELVVTNADGSDPVRIVGEEGTGAVGPDFLGLAWSPDGSQIAYAGRTMRAGVANRTIFVVAADGSGRPTVLDGHWEAVSWSPDGRRLVLVGFPDPEDPTFDLYTSDPDGSHIARLTHDASGERSPSWSPDGSRIVFTDGPELDPDVFVMAADGTGVRRLTDRRGWDLLPVWSPDGAWIAFTSDRGATPEQQAANRTGDDVSGFALYVMRPDGSDVRLLLGENHALMYATSWTW